MCSSDLFGGYPSLPVMIAASLAHVPAALHEQNAVLGRVNRLLAPRVSKIAANFPFVRFAPPDGGRVVFTGNPVRPEAAALKNADYGYILENGRIVMDGPAADLANNEDVKEFYLGVSGAGRKSFRDMKFYRRRKRWLA